MAADVEHWMTGTITDTHPLTAAVLYSFRQARDELSRCVAALAPDQLNARPAGVASVAFHVRHIAGSIDRLLTYAEDRPLSAEQLQALGREGDPAEDVASLTADFVRALESAEARVRALREDDFRTARSVGRRRLPSTVAGLLIHIAEHTQRHVGQAVTTARIVAHDRANAGQQ